MKQQQLTIIIPVYNTAEFLPRCLESVVNQTDPNIHIIIINDGSVDASDSIIQKYAIAHSNIDYIKLPKNVGVGNARNIGIENTTTEYLAFIDSDDWVDINYYRSLLQCIEQDKSDICISGIKTEVDDMYRWKYRYRYMETFCIDSKACLHALTNQYNQNLKISPIVNNRIYKTSLIKDNNIMFDKSRRAQDMYFSFMVFVYAQKVSFCHNSFYHYYQRMFSATHDFTKQYIDDYYNILSSLKEHLTTRGVFSTYQKEYECYINHCLTKLINNMFFKVQSTLEQKQYVLYILRQFTNLLSVEKMIEFIDVERIKAFWLLPTDLL